MPELDVRSIRGLAPGDRLSDDIDQLPDEPETQQHPLDSDKMRREHRQMLEWWYHRTRSSRRTGSKWRSTPILRQLPVG